MLQSYGIYTGVLFTSWLLAFFADKYNKKKLLWLIVILLTVIAGLRANTVGIDSFSYYTNFRIIASGRMEQVYGFEKSFKYICYFLTRIYDNPVFIFVILAFITNGCIIFRLWDFRNISSFSCAVACYYMAFFFMSMNVMRQFVAISIVFYATKYLINRKYILFIAGVLIAALFHQSAYIGVILIVIELFDWKSLSQKQKISFPFMVFLSPVVFYFIIERMSMYEKYLRNTNVDIGIMVFIKLVFLIATVVFLFVFKGEGNYLPKKSHLTNEDRRNILLICISYLIGICFAMSSYIIYAFNRIGWYFMIFESVYFGILLKGKNPLNKVIFIYIITFILGYSFVYSMTNNSQGTMPYLFFWQ